MTEEIKFEKAIERLEKIVEDLEAGNIPLEDALKKYEEGVKLSRACQEKLTQAEKKIETLTRAHDGSLKKEPFEPEEGASAAEEGAARKKSKKPAPRENTSNDEDLLL